MMKNLKMKSTMLALTVVCLFSSFKAADYVAVCGVIGTEGEIMRVQTDDPQNSIEQVILKGTSQTYFFDGCGENLCEYELESIPVGSYDATVITAFCSFNTTIVRR